MEGSGYAAMGTVQNIVRMLIIFCAAEWLEHKLQKRIGCTQRY